MTTFPAIADYAFLSTSATTFPGRALCVVSNGGPAGLRAYRSDNANGAAEARFPPTSRRPGLSLAADHAIRATAAVTSACGDRPGAARIRDEAWVHAYAVVMRVLAGRGSWHRRRVRS
jgi:hypothetical protein